jgi:serine/threonine-protein kinase
MGTVHLGRLVSSAGFSRTVAIKRLHPELASDPSVREKFANEARIAARVAHANVVAMLDVVSDDDELLLIMEYVHGVTLSALVSSARKRGDKAPPEVAARVIADALHGLHAAHEATDTNGAPLRLIHRDVSPQNILVGADGVTRVVDFGIAKALSREHVTANGVLRGKLPFMAPEQLMGRAIDRRVDVYAAGVVLWEALVGRRLFDMVGKVQVAAHILEARVEPPSRWNPEVPPYLDAIVMRAIARDPDARFATARDMALALEATTLASTSAVAAWVEANAHGVLASHAGRIAEMERARSPEEEPCVRVASVVFSKSAALPSAAPARPSSEPAMTMETPTTPRVTPGAARTPAWVAQAIGVAMIVTFGVATLASVRRAPRAALPVTSPSLAASITSDPVGITVLEPSAIVGAPASSTTTRSDAPSIVASVEDAPSIAPARPASSTGHADAKSGAPVRWCKVYDAEKQIFTVKSLRGGRCP